MAAQYTEVTLDDMEKFLKRGFRALRPKQAVQNGEYFYDLALSPNVAIRVWTSVRRGTSSGAGVGEDAIRVQLMGVPNKRPLMSGKAPIVKRTQGWRNTLQNKIEDLMEQYDEREGYWETRAGGQPAVREVPPPAPPPAEVNDNDGESYADDMPPPSPPPTGEVLRGTFTNYRGEWRARIKGKGSAGAKAILETKGNRKVPVILEHKVWSGQDNYGDRGYIEIWSIEDRGRQAAADEDDEGSYDYNRGGVN